MLVPPLLSAELRANFRAAERGWGSLPVQARIGGSSWRTSLFFDSKRAGYLLPIKAEIRKKEKLQAGDSPAIQLEILI